MEEVLRERVRAVLGRPYRCANPHLACVFFVLEMTAPHSREMAQILERVMSLEVGANKRTLIRQDYFSKFIRTTRLRPLPLADLRCGDLLLINEYSKKRRIDHLGLYLGRGEYVHLERDDNKGDFAVIADLDDNRHKIMGAVRGRKDHG